MNACPFCRASNKPTAKFCGTCGKPFGGQGSEWKKCKNGHSYQGAVCKHCPPSNARGAAPTEVENSPAPGTNFPFVIPKEKTEVEGSGNRRDVTIVESGDEDAPKRLVGWLVVIKSGTEKLYKYFPLYGERNTIRRAGKGNASISINDPAVTGERPHAMLDHEDGVYFLKDNGSTAGTKVNGKGIRETVSLQEHDRIQVGKTTLVFRSFQVLAEG